MLDIKFIRENKDVVQSGAKKKHIDVDIDALIGLDDERLKILKEVEELRSEVNRVSNDIARDQDPALKIRDLIRGAVQKFGENIRIARFTRYSLSDSISG